LHLALLVVSKSQQQSTAIQTLRVYAAASANGSGSAEKALFQGLIARKSAANAGTAPAGGLRSS
jgi:hypothetical protein